MTDKSFSKLSVQEFHLRLTKAIKDDAHNLYKQKAEITKVENLIEHSPLKFLRERPDIVIYSKLKPLGLYEAFCEYAGQSLTKVQSYTLSKVIELEYKLVVPRIMLPLSVTESFVLYDETRSKIVSNILGSHSPAGMYDTVLNRLVQQSKSKIPVPTGLVIGQMDNDQVLGKTHDQKLFNKQHLSIVNANCHIVVDSHDKYQYSKESYPGNTIYRDLTEAEIKTKLPETLNSYKGCHRSTRAKSINIAVNHLKSKQSHAVLDNLYLGLESDLRDKKVCQVCNYLASSDVGRKCPSCGNILKLVTEEMIYTKFKNVAGDRLDCRYFPGSGFDPQTKTESKTSCVLPGDPDILPPTKKENIASILNTCGHRAGVNQVLGSISDQELPDGRYSFWVGNDLYIFIIARELCKSTFTHVPCMQAFKGLERLKLHIEDCSSEMGVEVDPVYKIPELENCIFTFGWALMVDGLWHLEFNSAMRIHDRILKPVFGNCLAQLFGRRSPKAIENFYMAKDHHKGNFDLEIIYLGGKFLLIKTFMEQTPPPYSADKYFKWITEVKNQYILFLNQLVMGVLESYFQLKEGIKSGDDDMLMAGLMELEKIFFFKKSNRNYQQCAAYRAGDLIKMPEEMRKRRIAYQTTDATAYNSVHIRDEQSEDLISEKDKSEDDKKSLFEKQGQYPGARQGHDACLEQLIKRSKKGGKITNMDARGWNTEFRTMRSNIGLRKKMERDLGNNFHSHGIHVRLNLAEIVMFETLLIKKGWLESPEERRANFLNLDQDKELSADLINFWAKCGVNRDLGVTQLVKNERVEFIDVCALAIENDEKLKDKKSMLRDLPKLIGDINQENPAKTILEQHFEQEIRNCKKVATIANFYDHILQIVTDQSEDISWSENESDTEDNIHMDPI